MILERRSLAALLATLVPCAHAAQAPGAERPAAGRRSAGRDGATAQTERAVLDGLRWLARHQDPDGSWSATTLRERCDSSDPSYAPDTPYSDHYDEGLTGLALLCFLGAGFQPESRQELVDLATGKRHVVGAIVRAGLDCLIARQKPDGSFSRSGAFSYNEAIATAALCEAYGLTQDARLFRPARRALAFLEASQRPSPTGLGAWGWHYLPRSAFDTPAAARDEQRKRELFRSDLSNTGWALMALATGRIAELPVREEALLGALAFARYVSVDGGLAGYEDPKFAGAKVIGPRDHFVYHTSTMSALSMCVRMFGAQDLADPFLKAAAEHIVKDLPVVSKDRLSVDYYSWYWCTLALQQYDGPRAAGRTGKYFAAWNKALVEALLALQDRSEKACTNGAWLAPDAWSHAGGPLTTTTLAILTLESHYRFDPIGARPVQAPPARLDGTSENSFLTSLKAVRDALATAEPAQAAAFDDAIAYQREVRCGLADADAPAPRAMRTELDGFAARDVLRLVAAQLDGATESDLTWLRKRVQSGDGRPPCSAWLVERWVAGANRAARAAAIASGGDLLAPGSLRIEPGTALTSARAGCLEGLRESLCADPGQTGTIAVRMSAQRDEVARKLADAGKDPDAARAVGAQDRTERVGKAALERLAGARTDEDLWKRVRAFDAALVELDRAGDDAAQRVERPWTPAPAAASSDAPAIDARTLAELRSKAILLGGRPHLGRDALAAFLSANSAVRVVPVATGRIALLEPHGDGEGLLLAAELWCDAHWRVASRGD